MIAGRSNTFTLDELSAQVAERLRERGLLGAQPDARVSAAPDPRTVRYYTTLGLLDRPAIVGREARYGSRHVLQLLAVKALQGAALPLAEVQSRLYGRSDAELEAIVEAAAARARAEGGSTARAVPKPIAWREVAIEPGLKVMAVEGWAPGESAEALLEKIRAALAALTAPGAQ